ncbi:hypothetical protein FRC08_013234 [Ceratobasidium sp. 394]|nr:hypothetical protein FRC08_013234 [Ceratobasidium sp. 394]
MPPQHPTGRPRCNACVTHHDRCYREFPRCRACVRRDRECVYPEAQESDGEDPPQNAPPANEPAGPAPHAGDPPPSNRDNASSALTDPEPEDDGPPRLNRDGLRNPRWTPTEENWGPQAGRSRRTASLSSLLGGENPRNKRRRNSPDQAAIGRHERRADELRRELNKELDRLDRARAHPREAQGAGGHRDERRHRASSHQGRQGKYQPDITPPTASPHVPSSPTTIHTLHHVSIPPPNMRYASLTIRRLRTTSPTLRRCAIHHLHHAPLRPLPDRRCVS